MGLRRAGWEVLVCERSGFRNEVGAAISVPPNATRLLDAWGFPFDGAGAGAGEEGGGRAPVENLSTR
ncbi:hypothetical protein F5Y15DRAFT_389390 [Xylariaceae sp. FL0016]|nr:hypothetical protein F5Y15DRAFT_389390 [Xylariaceae sp. FL0016]